MMSLRKIIHIDMDAFYASVELRKRPDLIEQPVVIASHHPRAVIAAASYAARRFGLRSAMPMHQAKKLCPHVIVLEPNFAEYRSVSAQIHEIFQKHTAIIEPLSLDEAYLDVTHNLLDLPSATAVAEAIRADIYQTTQLTASAGVAPNKFLAKIASDWNKPNGICVIKPSQVQAFIQNLPLKKIPGVGQVTQEKLLALGLKTLGDLQQIEAHILIQHFGKYGQQLFLYAQGIDHRAVESERERQQISKEITFDHNLNLQECQMYWHRLLKQVWQTLEQKNLMARGISIKLKLPNFHVIQQSKSFKQSFQSLDELYQAFDLLIQDLKVDAHLRFRLIGVGVYQLQNPSDQAQLQLW